jgi:hypothetical protein
VILLDDRQMVVQPEQIVKLEWVPIELCMLGSPQAINPAAIERAYCRLLQLDQAQSFPPPNGVWQGERFVIYDGRHEYLAALAAGRTQLLVAWLEEK